MARTVAGLLTLTAIASVPVLSQDRERPPSRVVGGVTLYEVLPHDAIPAIDSPLLRSIEEARKRADPDEPFLVVDVDGESHAYSTWLLEGHEIVNDVVGGAPIAATW